MVWEDEPQPAHWRIRSQHATRQQSRTSRIIYLGIMFPFSILISTLLLFLLTGFAIFAAVFILFFYVLIFIFLPVYLIIVIFAIWSLHVLKRFTGIGPESFTENPNTSIKAKVQGFAEIITFALTWRWAEAAESINSDDYFLDPKGPYEPYTYKALSIDSDEADIRVLDVLPGERESPIHCRIRHVSLKHGEPAYEAISYCWGGEVPSVPVYVDDDGEGKPSQILVTKNLIQAFQRFRQSDQERAVWADGICINQGLDPKAKDERNRQVKLMGLIYHKAQHCLIWLGRGPDAAKEYLDAIKELVQLETELISADIPVDPIFLSPEEKARYKIPQGQSPHLKGLQLILSNPWLTRVWIVQEASLAQQAIIFLGDGSVVWDDLVAAQKFARNLGLLLAESEPQVDGILAIGYNRIFQDRRLPVKGEKNILALLARFRNFDASNAEDKIYGLLSLLSESHRAEWVVGDGAEQAYLDAANRILNCDKTLDLLGIPSLLDSSLRLETEKSGIVRLPSWVPDWRPNQVPVSLRMLEFAPHRARKFETTKETTYSINLDRDGNHLGVDGYRISAIQILGDLYCYRPIKIGISDKEFMRQRVNNIIHLGDTYFSWKQTVQLSSHEESYPHSATPISIREAFWRTVVALRLLIGIIPFVHAMHSNWLGRILLSPLTPILYTLYSIMAQDPEAQDFSNNTLFALGRRIAKTDDGHFALVPGNTEVGDEITLLKGARAPIVLRKHLDNDNWEHVGESYVEGLMNGERWDESLCERRWLA